jgi:hypothetical protein
MSLCRASWHHTLTRALTLTPQLTDRISVDVVDAGEEILSPYDCLVLSKPQKLFQDPRLVDPSCKVETGNTN